MKEDRKMKKNISEKDPTIDKKMSGKLNQYIDEKILASVITDEEEKHQVLQMVMGHISKETQRIVDEKYEKNPAFTPLIYDMVLTNFILNLLVRSQHLKNTYVLNVANVIHQEKERGDIDCIGS